jgi:hypothetical protein
MKRQAENLDVGMKRCEKNIKKAISNVAGYFFDFILQNIIKCFRLLIYEIVSFMNFQTLLLRFPY